MKLDLHEISKIRFGVYSHEEIVNLSVVKLTSGKKHGRGTVYDPLMGAIGADLCETCGHDAIKCPGHFGHIELNEAILHPLYIKRVLAYLRCMCIDCHNLLFTTEHLQLHEIDGHTGEKKFKMIQKLCSKLDICTRCTSPQPQFKHNITDSSISMTFVDENKKKATLDVLAQDIKKMFDNLTDDDVRLMGFDPTLVHPRNLVLTSILVLPPCGRPYVKAAGNLCDDDLSNQYAEIIKANNKLSAEKNDISPTKRMKALQTLKFRIHTTFNNSSGKAKHTTNGRPVKCIKTRISGKDGQMRANIMGRRADQTARTVIGPDTTLKNDEMIVPRQIAKTLTIPVRVTSFNKTQMENIVNTGKAMYLLRDKGPPGNKTQVRINLAHALVDRGTPLHETDKIILKNGTEVMLNSDSMVSSDRLRNGLLPGERLFKRCPDGTDEYEEVHDVQCRGKKYFHIEIGDIVERCLRDGDYVLLNRQPTLHKASMMAFKIFVRDAKTFRFNLACAKAFNADFDGDEMNIHVPQSLEAQAEIKYLSSVPNNFINCQSSKLNIVIVQDGVLGAYMMTRKHARKLSRAEFFQATMRLSMSSGQVIDRMKEIERVIAVENETGTTSTTLYSGRGLISLILPNDFNYSARIGKEEDEPVLTIKEGVILTGCLSKTAIGSAHNCIPHHIYSEYGIDAAMEVINSIQFLANEWLQLTSFSIGIGDCLVTEKTTETVEDSVNKCFMEAEVIAKSTRNPHVRESRINSALGKAKDIGLRIAKDALDPTNNFISTVTGGSKGDFFNIAQITGLLGQQNLSGKRIPLFLNNQTRSLPHYPRKDLTVQERYESRGMIRSSFIKGLNPREFFFHACSGREGMSDTAVGTAVSGYIQRRIVKLQEDIKINYDGTVRDETGRIFQLQYGVHGYDPSKTIRSAAKDQTFVDIHRLADSLNRKFEK